MCSFADIIIFVNEAAESCDDKIRGRMDRLKQLFPNTEIIKCIPDYPGHQISLYHKRDYITGPRVVHFVEYATWLRKVPQEYQTKNLKISLCSISNPNNLACEKAFFFPVCRQLFFIEFRVFI